MTLLKILTFFNLYLMCSSCAQDNIYSKSTREKTPESHEDYLWQRNAWLNSEELDKADALQEQLIKITSITKEKAIFDEYLKILTLVGKTDEQINTWNEASLDDRIRLMKHFIFVGLNYGNGEFSFVNNPRLASLFEMDYFYFYPSRKFIDNTLSNHSFSKTDKRLAKYLLGAMLVMQASLKLKHDPLNNEALVAYLAKNCSFLKYGQTTVFVENLYKIQDKLERSVSSLLYYKKAFITAFESAKFSSVKKTYPMFLRSDYPYWPIDYSEVMAARIYYEPSKSVFCITFGGFSSCRGTGFLAKRKGKVLFFTAGHGQFKRKVSVMKQKDPKPDNFGKEKSQLSWISHNTDIFNFAEELLIPTLKALDFDSKQIKSITASLGNNPYASSYKSLFVHIMPWIDMAIAIPDNSFLNGSGTKSSEILELGTLQDVLINKDDTIFGYNIGFGNSENLVSGNINADKGFGLRKFRRGNLAKAGVEFENNISKKINFYSPLKYNDFNTDTGYSTFSMRFDNGFSGSPIFVNNIIYGLMQLSLSVDGAYVGDGINDFNHKTLALLDDLIGDARGLFAIPEADLIAIVRKNIYASSDERASIKAHITKTYLH